MIKLVASDIDGTLLQGGNQKLDPQIFDLIGELHNRGIVFVAASGRQYDNLYRLFGPVQDEIFYICENGCLVKYKGRTLYKATIEDELALNILHKIWEKEDAEILLSGENTSYIKPKTMEYENHMKNIVKYNVTVVEDIFTLREPVIKISVYEQAGIEAFQKYWCNMFDDRVTAVTSGYEWLDFNKTGANKGSALVALCAHLGIHLKECMAFGDEYNDIEMLTQVEYSYAMETAKPGVKKVASYSTDHVETVLARLINSNGEVEGLL